MFKRILVAMLVWAATLQLAVAQVVPLNKATLKELVQSGSDEAVRTLNERMRSGEGTGFEQSSRALIQIAKRRLMDGDNGKALEIAGNIWLSSSPHDARVDAWKIIYLVEYRPRLLPAGQVVTLVASGGRDHQRFLDWLRNEFVMKHGWIIDVEVF